MRDHRALIVFKLSHQLVLATHALVTSLPGLDEATARQLCHAALDVPTHIIRACSDPGRRRQVDNAAQAIVDTWEVELVLKMAVEGGAVPAAAAEPVMELIGELRPRLRVLEDALGAGQGAA